MSLRLVMMGPQGVGKGTQAALLAERLGLANISTGDLFRGHATAGDDLGELVQSYTARGELVPDEVTNAVVRRRLAQSDVETGFILDGYPRNAAQVAELDAILADLGYNLDGVVELNADREELLSRIARRAELEGREDDTSEAISRRLNIYFEQTAPLSAAYEARGQLISVDGSGAIDEVAARIADAVTGVLS